MNGQVGNTFILIGQRVNKVNIYRKRVGVGYNLAGVSPAQTSNVQ